MSYTTANYGAKTLREARRDRRARARRLRASRFMPLALHVLCILGEFAIVIGLFAITFLFMVAFA